MIYMMSLVDVISIIAAGLVFTTFALPPKRWLTAIAVATNCAFVGYGLYLGLLPVWLMHMIIIGLHLLRYDLGIGRVKRGKHHA